jgi:hypothetical protein
MWKREDSHSGLAQKLPQHGMSSQNLCCSRGKGVSFSRSALFSHVVKRLVISLTSSYCETVCKVRSLSSSFRNSQREDFPELELTINGCGVQGILGSLIYCQ